MIVIFFVFIFLFLYSYVVFPTSLHYFSLKRYLQDSPMNRKITVLISAYNEEQNIVQTIESIFLSTSAEDIDRVLIGDDGSKDKTHELLTGLQVKYDKIILEKFDRLGKPSILNQLVKKYELNKEEYLLVFMDANIRIDPQCIGKLSDLLSDRQVGMAGASVIPMNEENNVESQYILRENRIKIQESEATGYAIGVFGACFALKGEYFQPIPSNFITDDLYLTMNIISQGRFVRYSMDAKAYEAISANVENEFRRKKRYAAGNFQILFHFISLLNPIKTSLGFVYCYFFHKIIRWISPLVFFGFWILSFFNLFGQYSRILMLTGTGLCLFLCLNYILTQWRLKPIGYRIYYFLTMNLAILLGFVNYLKGIKSNVWERSDR